MRILSGKIKGVFQFRLENRIFMKWLKVARERKSLKEEESYKKRLVVAGKVDEFRENKIKKSCFDNWRKVVRIEVEKRKLEVEREKTKHKIDNVLEGLLKPKILRKKVKTAEKQDDLKLNLSEITGNTSPNSQPKFTKKPTHSEKMVMVQQRKIIHEQKQLIEHLKKQKKQHSPTPSGDSSTPKPQHTFHTNLLKSRLNSKHPLCTAQQIHFVLNILSTLRSEANRPEAAWRFSQLYPVVVH